MKTLTLLLAAFLLAGSCALAQTAAATDDPFAFEDEDAGSSGVVADPLEKVNRGIFVFNDALMKVLIRPVSKVYTTVVPSFVRRRLDNAVSNVRAPIRVAGSLLQADLPGAGRETGRFLYDSTVGLAGLFKPSAKCPVFAVHDEDVGQAFGRWGAGPGFYLVLPVLGPSSARDALGTLGDRCADPLAQPFDIWERWEHRLAWSAGAAVVQAPASLELYDHMTKDAIDPYTAVRNAFIAYRASEISKLGSSAPAARDE